MQPSSPYGYFTRSRHRVPHTVKSPAHCPHCGSARIIRKGTRRKKLEIVQLWQCKLCRRVFTPAPAELRYKTYPLRIILDGVTLYNLGYSLPQAAAKLKSRHGYTVSSSTLASWMTEHRELTTYSRLRPQLRHLFPPTKTIRRLKLYHRQVYSFAYHRPKLALLRESRQHARLAPLADFLERIPNDCPHERQLARITNPEFRKPRSSHRCRERELRDTHRRAHRPHGRRQSLAARGATALHARQRLGNGRR